MRFKDLYPVMDKTYTVIFDEDYDVLASLTIGDCDLNKYSKECDKARELARRDEYIVTKVAMVNKFDENSFIAVTIKKDA